MIVRKVRTLKVSWALVEFLKVYPDISAAAVKLHVIMAETVQIINVERKC